jgi:hypothetical protein
VPPPHAAATTAPRAPRAEASSPADCGGGLGLLDRRHLMFSSAFVRQNASEEIVATIRKMISAIALASP